MAQLIVVNFERATDANGAPISGAQRKVFDAGTSNLSDVWTDAAGVTPGANPIIADSAGIFPNRYLAEGTYDVQYLDASDVAVGPTREDFVVSSSGGGGGGGGGDTFDVIVKISNYTITAADVLDKVPVFRCDASGIPGGELIITASAEDLGIDKSFFVINTGATGTIRIQPDVGETIDNESDVTLTGLGRGAGYVCVGAAGWETISTTAIQATKVVVSATPATDQIDFTVAGLEDAVDFKQINLAPTASINFNSVAGISEGERLVIANTLDGTGALGRLIILPHEHAASTAANRFFFADRQAKLLLPGESLSFIKAGSRIRPVDGKLFEDAFQTYTDCHRVDAYFDEVTGSGAIIGANQGADIATLGDTVQKAFGVIGINTGTTTTGGGVFGACRTGGIVRQVAPAQGQALYIARVVVGTLSDGSQTYSVRCGFTGVGATDTDVANGVYWEYLSTAATQWSMNCAGTSSRSKTASDVIVAVDKYYWLGIYITGDWTRADFFLSEDGKTWAFKGSQSGANMPTSAEPTSVAVAFKKSAGTTARGMGIDLQGDRYDMYRGAA